MDEIGVGIRPGFQGANECRIGIIHLEVYQGFVKRTAIEDIIGRMLRRLDKALMLDQP